LQADDQLRGLDEAVVIALGSNLKGSYGSVQDLLEAALGAMTNEGFRIIRRSKWWRSSAWPDPSEPAYLNGVVIVETEQGPLQALAALRRIETRFGRVRGAQNAPRTLDLDLIAYGRKVRDHADLELPHPRASERRFVMGPLAEIAPEWVHPVSNLTAQALADTAEIGRDAAPIRG
jgi:2-amino-4-hydroxy-6-hydroxymethyldihydropteridine diphosphokinase